MMRKYTGTWKRTEAAALHRKEIIMNERDLEAPSVFNPLEVPECFSPEGWAHACTEAFGSSYGLDETEKDLFRELLCDQYEESGVFIAGTAAEAAARSSGIDMRNICRRAEKALGAICDPCRPRQPGGTFLGAYERLCLRLGLFCRGWSEEYRAGSPGAGGFMDSHCESCSGPEYAADRLSRYFPENADPRFKKFLKLLLEAISGALAKDQ